MSSYSQKRTSTKSSYRGISYHKVCTISFIDDDNLVLQIVDLGRCTTEMLENALGNKVSIRHL